MNAKKSQIAFNGLLVGTVGCGGEERKTKRKGRKREVRVMVLK